MFTIFLNLPMELLLILAIAYSLLPLFLLFSHLGLKKKVQMLNKKIEALGAGRKSTLTKEEVPPLQSLTQVSTSPTVQSAPSSFDLLIQWFKVDWPMKTGAFLLLLGFAWLTTYAFMHNWIGPVGRISLGIVGGLLILILGEWRNKISTAQGGVLVALGAGVILVTIFAARTVYDFFTPGLALLFMALVVVFVAYSSVKRRIFSLGVLGFIMGSAAPLLVDSPEPNFIGLFSYLFVLCAGTVWVVGITGWRVFNNLALAAVAFYSVLYLEGISRFATERILVTEFVFASAFALLFLSSNVARMLKNNLASRSDLITAGGNALLFLYWIQNTINDDWKSLVTAVVMLVFFMAAYVLLKKTTLKESIYIYGAVTFLFLVAATRFEIQDNTLFILAYTIEATAVTAATLALMKAYKGSRYAFLLLVPSAIGGLMSLDSSNWNTGIAHPDFFVLLANAISLLGTGLYFYKQKWRESTALFIVGDFYTIAWIWLTADALIVDPAMGVMAALTIYTLAGVGFNLVGSAKEIPVARQLGAILIGLVVIRLLAVDVWSMDISGKIITFFVIGSLLLSTAFISKKLAHS